MAAAKIFGVEILNEGWGSSIDDAVSEMQVGFGGAGGWARQASQNRSLPSCSLSRLLPPLTPGEQEAGQSLIEVYVSHLFSAAYDNMGVPKESTKNIFCNVLLVSSW
jgi:hypothetical protein